MLAGGGAQVISSAHIWDSQVISFGAHVPASHSAQLSLPSVHEVSAHRVPGPLLLPSAHTGTPDEHEIVPLLQALLGLVMQASPALQSMHAPALLQTLSVPQDAPSGFAEPLVQTITPVAQLVTPFVHLSELVVQL